jgi:hypothetical protein
MTAKNQSWHITEPVFGLVAVNHCASAIMRLYTVEGIPEAISDEELDYDVLKAHSTAFIVEVKITKINKHFNFPLLSDYVEVEGKKELRWDDSEGFMLGRKITVDDIRLEDLIKFQRIEFEIVRGYKWTGAKDYKIRELVNRLFETIKKHKAEGNPLEAVYEQLLNNVCSKVQDPSDNCLLASHLSSMSERIMNEVMCLAEDEGHHIYYQEVAIFQNLAKHTNGNIIES